MQNANKQEVFTPIKLSIPLTKGTKEFPMKGAFMLMRSTMDLAQNVINAIREAFGFKDLVSARNAFHVPVHELAIVSAFSHDGDLQVIHVECEMNKTPHWISVEREGCVCVHSSLADAERWAGDRKSLDIKPDAEGFYPVF